MFIRSILVCFVTGAQYNVQCTIVKYDYRHCKLLVKAHSVTVQCHQLICSFVQKLELKPEFTLSTRDAVNGTANLGLLLRVYSDYCRDEI